MGYRSETAIHVIRRARGCFQGIIGVSMMSIPYLLMSKRIEKNCSKILWEASADTTKSIETLERTERYFNSLWITTFIVVPQCFPVRFGRVFSLLCFLLFFILFVTNSIIFAVTGYMFSFRLLSAVREGTPYMFYSILHTPYSVWLSCFWVFAAFMIAYHQYRWGSHFRGVLFAALITMHYIVHRSIVDSLGIVTEEAAWNNFEIPRNIYETFTDPNKNMKLCGLYEFTFRDCFHLLWSHNPRPSSKEFTFLKEQYSKQSEHHSNSYTGLFRGRNVIFLQLEGFDTWMLNEETTPTLYNLSQHALHFSNHYSFTLDSGATFHSEFCVNTGFRGPLTYNTNVYTLTSHSYPFSLPRMFRGVGYNPNVFHMNSREFYNRGLNYLNWGYSHYYGLLETTTFSGKNYTYMLDRTLIEDRLFYDKLFRSSGLFMHYIISYSIHHPFTISSDMGKMLTARYGLDKSHYKNEANVAKLFARETDKMVELLLQALENNNLFDSTVIVAYADHYPFTMWDKSFVKNVKHSSNNLVSNTPFFIWASDVQFTDVLKVNSQVDILPTILNLFGIPFMNEHYIGRDIFESAYHGYVIFPDGSYYDGNKYQLHWDDSLTQVVKKNDLTIKYNFFRIVS